MKPWSLNSIPAFCITLERRSDRWKLFSEDTEKEFTNIQPFFGVDGKTLDIKNDDRVLLSTKRNILNKTRRSHEELDSVGGVGCALSHIALWEYIANSTEHDLLIIFEDDITVRPGFVKHTDKIILNSSYLQNTDNWDILLLGSSTPIETKDNKFEPAVLDVKNFFGLFSYIITKQGAKNLLDHVYPIHSHIDLWICIFKKIYGFSILILKDNRIDHGNDKIIEKSDITNRECFICNIPSDYNGSIIIPDRYDNKWFMILLLSIVIVYIIYRKKERI